MNHFCPRVTRQPKLVIVEVPTRFRRETSLPLCCANCGSRLSTVTLDSPVSILSDSKPLKEDVQECLRNMPAAVSALPLKEAIEVSMRRK
ncbi:MAG: hypothetical protein KVP17_005007 [Porospora cf. gigantea B]|uniref:uncharacterized protein n=1 Tax=Porospora cf. gigantea B TaxID=2853592 RepID=UPI003571CCF4|nr:MAG: hypothetical protein KVP17_005007 [Porospora cf. gigantea B]